eukprot:2765371-Amphidinium_carterae.1
MSVKWLKFCAGEVEGRMERGLPLPDMPDVREPIESLQEAVIEFLKVAQSFGVSPLITEDS